MSVTNETAEQGPYEVLLELWRARDAGKPHPSREFLFEGQEYIRRWQAGRVKARGFAWGREVLADLEALQGEPMDWPVAERLGDQLAELLADLEFREDERSIEEALRAGRTVHLTLRFAAAELHALPWELVCVGNKALGAQPRLLLRYEWPGSTTAAPVREPPAEGGRILFTYSNAGGDVRADRHLEVLRQACRAGYHAFDEERDVVADVSLDKLKTALGEAPVAVLHILCHGGMVPSSIQSYGLLWREGDRITAVDARTLARALADHKGSLRLVVLSACHGGGQGDLTSRLGSVAQELHRLGIPAVVASRYPLSIRGSIDLTEVLYQKLLVESSSLEEAVIAARGRLCERPMKADWASLQLYARAADGLDHRPFVLRPYRGLEAFREQDRRFFFGRDDEVAEVVSDLENLVKEERPRFLVVAGASGTGKSSMVFAGAVPELCEKGWTLLRSFRPGNSPSAELAGTTEVLEEALQGARATRDESGPRFLVVVDQLEEIFTHLGEGPADREERDTFVRGLWDLARREDACVGVIVTMRVDFIGHCGDIVLEPGSGHRLDKHVVYREEHRVLVAQMDRDQLRIVLEEPAKKVGVRLDKGLCQTMLDAIDREPGALPLLQFALAALWEQRRHESQAEYILSRDVYDAPEFGGITGALARKADEVLARLATDAERDAARRLFQRLVSVRDDAQDTRRRVPLRDLHLEQQPDVQAVLDRFLGARLLVRDDPTVLVRDRRATTEVHGAEEARALPRSEPTVEVAHEALIKHWETLRRWVNEARKQLTDFDKLRDWAKEKRKADGRGAPYVLGGSQLDQALVIRSEHGSVLGEEATRDRLLHEALVLIDKSEEARRKEAEEKRRAEEEREKQRHRARQFALLAGAREFIARGEPHWAAKLLLCMKRGQTRGWDELAWKLLSWPGFLWAELEGHERGVRSAMFSPDGQRIVTASFDHTARVWNVDGKGEPVILRGHEESVNSAMFSPGGLRIVTASKDGTARVWNADGKGEPVVLKGHKYGVNSAVFSPDGKRIVTVSSGDGSARVWNADGKGEPVVLKSLNEQVISAVFSPDRWWIVTASLDGTARVWNTDSKGEPVVLKGHEGNVSFAVFSNDRQHVVTVSNGDGSARVWNTDGKGEPVVLKGHERGVESAMFSPDGQRIVTASWDKTARVWSADGKGEPVILRGHEESVNSAMFSPDGRRIVTASKDGTARVWNADGKGEPVVLKGHESWVTSAVFSPDGRHIVTASTDRTSRVWNPGGTGDLVILRGHEHGVESAMFSPDGQRIVTASHDGTACVWSADGTGEPVVLRGHGGRVRSAVFSPDGQRIITVSIDWISRVWNADGQGAPMVVSESEPAAVFSPDGQGIFTKSPSWFARVKFPPPPPGLPTSDFGARIEITLAVFSPNGERIVTASKDKAAHVWHADGTGWPVFLEGHEGEVTAAVFSPNGERIVTASKDRTARVWRADGRGEPVVLKGHDGPVTSAVFSPDNHQIVTTSSDKTARVWHADGQGEPVVLHGHQDRVRSAAFSPDGRRIVTASEDKTARVWIVDPEQIREALRRLTTVSLPPRLRRDYLDESEEEAQQRYEEEERGYGRLPASTGSG